MDREMLPGYCRLMRRVICAVLLIGVSWTVGCERLSEMVDPRVDPADAPQSVEFEVDGASVYYATLGEGGQTRPAAKLAEVPVSERGAVVVFLGEKTPGLTDSTMHYVADLVDAAPGDQRRARLASAEEIERVMRAGEQAARAGLAVRKTAIKMLDPETLAANRPLTRGSRVEPMGDWGKKKAAKKSKRAGADQGLDDSGYKLETLFDEEESRADSRVETEESGGHTIEIRRLNQGDGAYKWGEEQLREYARNNPIPRAERARGSKWKPVTLYYADWCGVCRKAKRWLDKRNVPYRGVDLEASNANKREMAAYMQSAGVKRNAIPLLSIDGKPMVGWSAQRFEQLARR